MRSWFRVSYWSAVLKSPAAMIGLAADLAPLWAVAFWGWGAAPLVLLYWLENVILGATTLLKMPVAAVGRSGPRGAFSVIFTCGFFTIHYGMFCFVHGGMLLTFLAGAPSSWPAGTLIASLVSNEILGALSLGQHMDWVFALMIAAHLLAFFDEFLRKEGWRRTTPDELMVEPYLRVIGLHIGVFFIGAVLMAIGDPQIGAMLLVIAKAAFSLWIRRQPAPSQAAPAAVLSSATGSGD